VDAIHVLRPIRFQSIRRNEVGSKASVGTIKSAMNKGSTDGLGIVVDEDRQQRASTILTDVDYVIEAHFERTAKWGDDDTDAKHIDTFSRRAARGQCFHQPCLGTREFAARFELIEPGSPLPQPPQDPMLGFGQLRDLGFMLWDIDHTAPGKPSIFFKALLDHGVLRVPQPGSPELRR
jgi:CRISPR-associated protein Cas5d